eukprot:scaffold250582_cov33-Prasinocladus_malaysianus.AAC.1
MFVATCGLVQICATKLLGQVQMQNVNTRKLNGLLGNWVAVSMGGGKGPDTQPDRVITGMNTVSSLAASWEQSRGGCWACSTALEAGACVDCDGVVSIQQASWRRLPQ